MPTFKITEEVKQKISQYKQFMQEHEYSESSIVGYCTYLSRFMRQSSQDETYPLHKSITDFLELEHIHNPATHKDCRAALYLYFKMVKGVNFPKRQPKEKNPEIESILEQFYDYSVNIKDIRPSSAMWEVSRIWDFLEYITAQHG